MTRARGVDISSVQGKCDFKKLKAGGFDFVIIKGTEGRKSIDSRFVEHINEAREAGIMVPLVYHVLTVGSSAYEQLQHVLDELLPYDVGVCIDFELDASPPMAPSQLVQRALDLAQGISFYRKTVLYSYPNFMRALRGTASLDLLAAMAEYWSADYRNEKLWPSETQDPYVPEAWKGRWAFWQWSGNNGLPAPGIPMVVDHCVFNGTVADLEQWAWVSKAEVGKNPDPNV